VIDNSEGLAISQLRYANVTSLDISRST